MSTFAIMQNNSHVTDRRHKVIECPSSNEEGNQYLWTYELCVQHTYHL